MIMEKGYVSILEHILSFVYHFQSILYFGKKISKNINEKKNKKI